MWKGGFTLRPSEQSEYQTRVRWPNTKSECYPSFSVSYGTMSCVSWSAVWIVPLIMYSTSPPSVFIHDWFYLDFIHVYHIRIAVITNNKNFFPRVRKTFWLYFSVALGDGHFAENEISAEESLAKSCECSLKFSNPTIRENRSLWLSWTPGEKQSDPWIARILIIGSESGLTSWRVRNKGTILKSFCPITTRALTRMINESPIPTCVFEFSVKTTILRCFRLTGRKNNGWPQLSGTQDKKWFDRWKIYHLYFFYLRA